MFEVCRAHTFPTVSSTATGRKRWWPGDSVESVTSPLGVEIRQALEADEPAVSACVDVAYAGYVERIGKKPAPMLDDYTILIENQVVHVATIDDQLVGLIVCWPNGDHLYVDNIAVLPQVQGTGVGAALLDFAELQARRAGLSEIRLYTNAEMAQNVQYYPRRGFRETHRACNAGYQRVYFSRLLEPLNPAQCR
ncbi:MAG: GNAT family N-acetyltransferase [bacterium]|nr:GNAT family N-acetyltransferase [bacterium]